MFFVMILLLFFLFLYLLIKSLTISIMNNFIIKHTALVILACVLAISCVPKRKYLETDSARIKGLQTIAVMTQEVSVLKEKVEDLKKEFNIIQNELRLSNARKDTYIDSLSKKMVGLSSDISKKDESHNDQLFLLQSEKLQLNSTINQNQSTIKELSGKITVQESEIAKINQEIITLKFDMSNQTEDLKSKNSTILVLEEQLKQLQTEIEKYKKENVSLKKKITAATNSNKKPANKP